MFINFTGIKSTTSIKEIMDFSAGTIKRINEHVVEISFVRDGEIDKKMALDI